MDDMPGPLTETGVRYLYVIGHETGPQKIGFSHYPPSRAQTLKKKGQPAPVAHWWAEVPLSDIYAVEALAHWILRDKALGGEMFDITPSDGRDVIEDAVARFALGERVPKDRPEICSIRLATVVSKDWIDRLDDFRVQEPGIPNRSEAVRILIAEALAAREKIKRKD